MHDFFCDDTFIKTTQTLFTTFAGETDRTWITSTYTVQSTVSTSGSGAFNTDATFNAPQPPSSTSNSAGSQSTASQTPAPTAAAADHQSKTPVGPIVGGVIGGLAVVAGLVALIIFFLRRNRNKGNSAAASAAAPTSTTAPPPGRPPAYIPDAAAKPPLDPNTNGYYAPNGQGGYVAPGGPYPPQHSPEMQQQQHPGYPPHPQQPGAGGYYDPNTAGGYYQPAPPASQPATSPTAFWTAGTETGSTGAYGYPSSRPGFSEMSANMAGRPFPSDQHAGTFEVEGSAPAVRPTGPMTELDGRAPVR